MVQDILERNLKKITSIEYLKPTLTREDIKGVLDCLIEDQLSTGQIVEKFEKLFASTFKFKHSISLNSLTSAYHIALKALEVTEGDTVLLSDIAPVSALDAIYLLKAMPVLVDIGKDSFHIDKEGFQKAMETYNPKVVILDHAFGSILNTIDYPISNSCSILEDFSEAIGVESESLHVGKQGKLSICNLHVESVITTGNGALIVSQEKDLVDSIKAMILGRSKSLVRYQPRFDYNLIDYQAALGLEQLSKLGVLLERKRKIGMAYLQAVQSSQVETYFRTPSEDTFNRFPIIVPFQDYESTKRYFDSLQIGTMRSISQPLHSILEVNNLEYPNTERLFKKGHCIPSYPNLTKDNIQRITSAIRRIY